jgi:flavin-binding protein dodecin
LSAPAGVAACAASAASSTAARPGGECSVVFIVAPCIEPLVRGGVPCRLPLRCNPPEGAASCHEPAHPGAPDAPRVSADGSNNKRRDPHATGPESEQAMAESVYKVIELVGTSSESWEKAAAAAVKQASKSLRDLRIAEIVQLDMQMQDGKIAAYRAKVKVSFKFESEK